MRQFLKAVGLLVVLLALASPVHATIYYLSPTGNDANAGTAGTIAWRTFAHAIPLLHPGDTLLLRDGTYTAAATGYPNITCGTNALAGSSGSPITLKAENERKAFLQGDGSTRPFQMHGCAYWTIEGLRLEDGDFPGASSGDEPGSIMVLKQTGPVPRNDHLIVRRNLLRYNNRYFNASAFSLLVQNSLFEENELYNFHRHGFQLFGGDNNVFRRNYANSRAWADIPGGYASANGDMNTGDGAFIYYGSGSTANTIWENNISEGNGEGYFNNAYYNDSDNEKVYGGISLHDTRGVMVFGGPSGQRAAGLLIQDYVAIGSGEFGFQIASARSSCVNCTMLNSASAEGFLVYVIGGAPGDGVYSFAGQNLLALDSPGTGITVSGAIPTWTINSSNAFGNSTNYSPSSSGNYTNKLSIAAGMGSCYLWVPDGAPMKGAGAGGTDLAATILYRYQDGTLTTTPLWDTGTGAFPCGATVAGVNDTAGNSCSNVHTRLHVNSGGCAFPASYGGGVPPPAPTQMLRLRLDAGSGSTAVDSTGNGFTGTLINTPTWMPGHVGPKSLLFDGVSQTLDIGQSLTAPAYTWSLWVQGVAPPGSGAIQKIISVASTDSLGMSWSHTNPLLRQAVQHRLAGGGAYVGAQLTTPLLANRWYHVAATYDGTTLKAYLNGQLQASTPAAASDLPQGTLRLGGGVSGEWWQGSVDELNVWNYALSAADVLAVYRSQAATPRHRTGMR